MFEWLLLLILSFGMFHSKSNFIQLSNVVDDDNGNAVQFVPFGLMVLTCVCAYTEKFIRIRLRMHIRKKTFFSFSLSFFPFLEKDQSSLLIHVRSVHCIVHTKIYSIHKTQFFLFLHLHSLFLLLHCLIQCFQFHSETNEKHKRAKSPTHSLARTTSSIFA